MSVLMCDRSNCMNVMCDILIQGSRYICNECANEFKEYIGDQTMPIQEMTRIFEAFMNSAKSEHNENKITVDEFLYKKTEYIIREQNEIRSKAYWKM